MSLWGGCTLWLSLPWWSIPCFGAKQLPTFTPVWYSPSEHEPGAEGKSQLDYQLHQRCLEQGVLTNTGCCNKHQCPTARGREGLLWRWKQPCLHSQMAFTAHSKQEGLVQKGFRVGQEKCSFLQPLCPGGVLGSISGVKDYPRSCCSPKPAAHEIPDPWTTPKSKYPEPKLLNLSSLGCCSAVNLNFSYFMILHRYSSWKLVFSCSQL